MGVPWGILLIGIRLQGPQKRRKQTINCHVERVALSTALRVLSCRVTRYDIWGRYNTRAWPQPRLSEEARGVPQPYTSL